MIRNNLIMEMLSPATWNGREEVRYTWFSLLDLIGATGVTLEGNHLAGSERAGYWVCYTDVPLNTQYKLFVGDNGLVRIIRFFAKFAFRLSNKKQVKPHLFWPNPICT